MTKSVRIENADTSNHELVVETWEVDLNGERTLVHATPLTHPTAMATLTVHATRYLVVKEMKNAADRA